MRQSSQLQSSANRKVEPPTVFLAPESAGASQEDNGPRAAPAPDGRWGTLELIPKEGFSGSERARATLNRGLQRGWRSGDAVGWILARVRCEVFRLTPTELIRAGSTVPKNTLMYLEEGRNRGGVQMHSATSFSAILASWDRVAGAIGDPRVTSLVAEARNELLKLVTPAHLTGDSRLLTRWIFEVGPERFRQAGGPSRNTLWQRAEHGMAPSIAQMLSLAESLSLIPTGLSPRERILHPRMREIEEAWLEGCSERGRLPVIARLHLLVAATGQEVHKPYGGRWGGSHVGQSTARLITDFELVPWPRVAKVFGALLRLGVLSAEEHAQMKQEWELAWQSRPPRAEQRVLQLAKSRGITSRELADALELPSEGQRRVPRLLTHALAGRKSSRKVPFGVVAHIVADSRAVAEELIAHKRGEVLAALKRKGSLKSSPFTAERQVWGVLIEDLPFPKRDLQRMEWNLRQPLMEQQVLESVRALGEAKVAAALARRRERFLPLTVSEALQGALGGKPTAGVESGSSVADRESGPQVSADGGTISLLQLKGLLRGRGVTLSPALELDWREQMARHVALQEATPIARSLRAAALGVTTRLKRATCAEAIRLASEVGAMTREQVAEACASLRIAPRSRTAAFLRIVSESATMPLAISRWLRQHPDREGAQQALARYVSRCVPPGFVGPAPLLSGDVAAELAVLRDLPGAVAGEIREALAQSGQEPSGAARLSIRRLGSMGVDAHALLFAAGHGGDCSAETRQQMLIAITHGIASPQLPLGVLASLAPRGGSSPEAAIAEARSEVQEALQQAGLPSGALVVEMKLWGIRESDLVVPAPTLWRALRGEDPQAEQLVAGQVEFLAQQRVSRFAGRLNDLRSARKPGDVLRVACRSIPGGESRVAALLGVPSEALPSYLSGERVPLLPALVQVSEQAGLADLPGIGREWRFAFGEMMANARVLPLPRALLTAICSRMTISGIAADRTGSDVQAILSAYDAWTGSGDSAVHRAIDDALVSAEMSRAPLGKIMRSLNIPPHSLQHSFFEECCGNEDMAQAIVDWWKAHRKDKDFDAALQRVALREVKSQPGSAPPRPKSASDIDESISLAIAGATRAELARAMAEVERKRAALDRGAITCKSGPWALGAELRTASFERRIDAVAKRLRERKLVSIENLKELLHERAGAISAITGSLGIDGLWYVASAAFFREPAEALSVMARAIRAGKRAKFNGEEQLAYTEKWVADRGSLGKLGEGSAGLSFL